MDLDFIAKLDYPLQVVGELVDELGVVAVKSHDPVGCLYLAGGGECIVGPAVKLGSRLKNRRFNEPRRPRLIIFVYRHGDDVGLDADDAAELLHTARRVLRALLVGPVL